MFSKSDFEKMMADNKGKTFVIKTNNANGHGINGVSYDTFFSYRKQTERGGIDETRCVVTRMKVKEITDSTVVFDVVAKKYSETTYNKVTREQYVRYSYTTKYLPLDAIVDIDFIAPHAEFYGYMCEKDKFIDPENK